MHNINNTKMISSLTLILLHLVQNVYSHDIFNYPSSKSKKHGSSYASYSSKKSHYSSKRSKKGSYNDDDWYLSTINTNNAIIDGIVSATSNENMFLNNLIHGSTNIGGESLLVQQNQQQQHATSSTVTTSTVKTSREETHHTSVKTISDEEQSKDNNVIGTTTTKIIEKKNPGGGTTETTSTETIVGANTNTPETKTEIIESPTIIETNNKELIEQELNEEKPSSSSSGFGDETKYLINNDNNNETITSTTEEEAEEEVVSSSNENTNNNTANNLESDFLINLNDDDDDDNSNENILKDNCDIMKSNKNGIDGNNNRNLQDNLINFDYELQYDLSTFGDLNTVLSELEQLIQNDIVKNIFGCDNAGDDSYQNYSNSIIVNDDDLSDRRQLHTGHNVTSTGYLYGTSSLPSDYEAKDNTYEMEEEGVGRSKVNGKLTAYYITQEEAEEDDDEVLGPKGSTDHILSLIQSSMEQDKYVGSAILKVIYLPPPSNNDGANTTSTSSSSPRSTANLLGDAQSVQSYHKIGLSTMAIAFISASAALFALWCAYILKKNTHTKQRRSRHLIKQYDDDKNDKLATDVSSLGSSHGNCTVNTVCILKDLQHQPVPLTANIWTSQSTTTTTIPRTSTTTTNTRSTSNRKSNKSVVSNKSPRLPPSYLPIQHQTQNNINTNGSYILSPTESIVLDDYYYDDDDDDYTTMENGIEVATTDYRKSISNTMSF